MQKARKELKAKQKRGKTVVVGDMSEMMDTLPTLEWLMKESPDSTQAKYAIYTFLFS